MRKLLSLFSTYPLILISKDTRFSENTLYLKKNSMQELNYTYK